MPLPSEGCGFWVFHAPNERSSSDSDVGKWMLFYPNRDMDHSWAQAILAMDSGHLPGVTSMKASTLTCLNPRASSTENGVIIMYCHDSWNEAHIKQIGERIVKVMDLQSRLKSPYIYYKTNAQTQVGTAATGCRKNWLYRLPLTRSVAKQTCCAEHCLIVNKKVR